MEEEEEFGENGWQPSDFELDMAKRKITLLNYEHTMIFLRDCLKANPEMPLTEALLRARILFVETRISIEGATPAYTEALRELRESLPD